MPIYSVSLPVCSHVVVDVKADTEEDAANLALDVAQLSDAEPIDFLLKDPDVVEILPGEVPEAFVWTSKTVKQKI